MSGAKEKFRRLAERLKACPSLDTRISKSALLETWKCFQRLDPEQGDEVTPAIMAGILLFDEEQFSPLLTADELTQLAAIASRALDRYQLKTNPPNQPGKALAASLKKESI